MGKSFWMNDDYDTRYGRVVGACIAFVILLSFIGALVNILYVEGVPITVEGRIQLVEFKHNKFWNYDYTFIEIQTYSGDTHHYEFLKHLDITFDGAYRFTYTRTSLLGHHMMMYNKVIEVQSLR